MVQLGFVIDHSRCIGCHACTVACKSENDVPVGSFRTWVKYTESGTFPSVRRSFAVLRCNQCSDAPCVTICPVTALDKRSDGIVDVDSSVCIGCKGCMQACPYDALYIDDATGTAEKCHFCAHRTERGLAPACTVVCPTEALIPGDFDDPDSVVSKLKASGELVARKTEAGTGPNVWYREVAAAGVKPLETNGAGGYLWANRLPGDPLEAQRFLATLEDRAEARTTYDVEHPPRWGGMVSAYLFTKSISAGAFLAGALVAARHDFGLPGFARWAVPAVGMAFLLVTLGLLVGDLKRPDRFLLILKRPNWDSWIAKGAIVLTAYAVLLAVWLGLAALGFQTGGLGGAGLVGATAVAAGLSAAYTAWLFGQAKGRVLWMKRGLAFHLLVQALLAGCATFLLFGGAFGADAVALERGLAGALALQLVMLLAENRLAPKGREAEYHRVASLVTKGPFARRHWGVGVGLGIVVPLGLLAATSSAPFAAVAALLALVGLLATEDVFVRAGQALPIS
jgi:Fe-S-cluster-containing dehydrogenase component